MKKRSCFPLKDCSDPAGHGQKGCKIITVAVSVKQEQTHRRACVVCIMWVRVCTVIPTGARLATVRARSRRALGKRKRIEPSGLDTHTSRCTARARSNTITKTAITNYREPRVRKKSCQSQREARHKAQRSRYPRGRSSAYRRKFNYTTGAAKEQVHQEGSAGPWARTDAREKKGSEEERQPEGGRTQKHKYGPLA
jgi:hypothetical protein